MLLNIRPSHLSVRTCELWQNGWLDPDAVWGGECGRSRNGCTRFWWWSSKGKGSFGGEFGASHCNQWGLCDALFSNYFDDLLIWMRRTIFFGGKLPGDRFTPETADFAVNQRNAVDWEVVLSERRQVGEVGEHRRLLAIRRSVQHLQQSSNTRVTRKQICVGTRSSCHNMPLSACCFLTALLSCWSDHRPGKHWSDRRTADRRFTANTFRGNTLY